MKRLAIFECFVSIPLLVETEIFVSRFNKKQEFNALWGDSIQYELKQHLRILIDLGSNTSKTYSSHGYNRTISILLKLWWNWMIDVNSYVTLYSIFSTGRKRTSFTFTNLECFFKGWQPYITLYPKGVILWSKRWTATLTSVKACRVSASSATKINTSL